MRDVFGKLRQLIEELDEAEDWQVHHVNSRANSLKRELLAEVEAIEKYFDAIEDER